MSKKDTNKNSEIAIKVDRVSKTFRIPHEKITSVKGAITGVLKRKKGYEEFKALDNVSFEVKKGEFFGIIGRNGSGKSTLLKILAGIYQPDPIEYKKGKKGFIQRGKHGKQVVVNGMISPFLELGIGFNPELSGRDNVYLNATVLGMTKKQIDEKFDDIVKFSELERFIDQKLKNYSSGMQVRLAFSVSIHANRDILLMDEVLAVGDSNFQSKCLEEFNKYRDMGRTVIIVTHDISVVEKYCDRAMLLRNGKIVKIGKAGEVAEKYIYENIYDENERGISEDKEKKYSNSTNAQHKKAEISKVEFLDENGKIKNVFKTHESVIIRIYYKINDKSISEFNIGLSVVDDRGSYIFGYNTDMDYFVIDKTKNYVDMFFRDMPFLKGIYMVSPSIFKRTGLVAFDYLPNFKALKIISGINVEKYKGMISIKHNWMQ